MNQIRLCLSKLAEVYKPSLLYRSPLSLAGQNFETHPVLLGAYWCAASYPMGNRRKPLAYVGSYHVEVPITI